MGGGSHRPRIPDQAPAPTYIEPAEIDKAKKKGKKRRGRESTIFAGRLMEEVRARGARILG